MYALLYAIFIGGAVWMVSVLGDDALSPVMLGVVLFTVVSCAAGGAMALCCQGVEECDEL